MTDKAPKWKRAGNDGEIEIKFPTGRRFKIEKQYDHNIRHKGEWKVMEWDTRTRDWEWADTYSPKAYAKQMAMELGQYKNGKKVADYSHTFQYESYDWVCGKCNCEPCVCEGDGMEIKESVKPHPEVVKAYKKTLDADHKHGEYGTTATKRAMTRTANTLSKKIKQHHPDLDMKGNIALRTALQNMKESYDKEYKHHSQGLKDAEADIKSAKSHDAMIKAMNKKSHHSKALNKMNRMKEEVTTAADAGIPQDTANMGPRFNPKNVTDRRRKKQMVLLKRFRKYMEDNG